MVRELNMIALKTVTEGSPCWHAAGWLYHAVPGAVLEMNIWIYCFELANSWNLFYIYLNKNWKNYWTWAEGTVLIVMNAGLSPLLHCVVVFFCVKRLWEVML
jgi:hypothetical protein